MNIDLQKMNYKNCFDSLSTINLKELDISDLVALTNKISEFKQFWDIENDIYKAKIINALYGIMKEKHSPINHPVNAESVTSCGQLCVRGSSAYIDEKLLNEAKVFYNDTDSMFITIPSIECSDSKDFVEKTTAYVNKKIAPNIKEFFEDFAKKMNVKNLMKMDIESYCDQIIMHSPKKYIARLILHKGLFYDKKQYNFKIKGMEIIRGDSPVWVRDKIYDSLRIIFDGTNDEMIEYINKCKKEFMKLDMLDIAKPTSVQDMDKYKIGEKGAPRHVKSSMVYNSFLEDNNLSMDYQKIYSGAKIAICYLDEIGEAKIGLNSIAINLQDKFPPMLYDIVKDHIDYDTMWDKVFVAPLNRLMDDVGWSFEKKNNFFDEI